MITTALPEQQEQSSFKDSPEQLIVVLVDETTPYTADSLYNFFELLDNYYYIFNVMVINVTHTTQETLDQSFRNIFIVFNLSKDWKITVRNAKFHVVCPFSKDNQIHEECDLPKHIHVYNGETTIELVPTLGFLPNKNNIHRYFTLTENFYSFARTVHCAPKEFNPEKEGHSGVSLAFRLNKSFYFLCYDFIGTKIPLNSTAGKELFRSSGCTNYRGGLIFLNEFINKICS